MATQHLDLDEQEQLAQIKHFWNQYGNLISWILLCVFGALAAWNGWKYWQRYQAEGASAMYETVDAAVQARDMARLERALGDMKERFPRTTYAHQAALLAAGSFYEAGKRDQARAALNWVIDRSGDVHYRALAKLRLAAVLLDDKSYDAALKVLSMIESPHFAGLVSDRRGDVHMAQGQREQARTEYQKAYAALGAEVEYRRIVEAKLNTLGVDASTLKTTGDAVGKGKQ
jgi:predicted negative regulator of RcsB-dependent stress response